MSTPSVAIPQRSPALEWAAVAAGLVLLVMRAYVPFGVRALAVVYLAMSALAVAPSRESAARVHPTAVVGIGLAAVWLAAQAGGTALPAAGVTTAAVVLNLLAAMGEEAFFRKFLYDRTA